MSKILGLISGRGRVEARIHVLKCHTEMPPLQQHARASSVGLWRLIVYISSQLRNQWHHVGGLKLAKMEVFIYLLFPSKCIYQHLTGRLWYRCYNISNSYAEGALEKNKKRNIKVRDDGEWKVPGDKKIILEGWMGGRLLDDCRNDQRDQKKEKASITCHLIDRGLVFTGRVRLAETVWGFPCK